jgi:hypothetical protein
MKYSIHSLNQHNNKAKVTAWAFKEGVKAILEIIGDKKFSEEDVINSYHCGRSYQGREGDTTITKYLQSLQQTSIEVEVVMDIDNPCPKCGEEENIHGNYDYSDINRPLINTLCNECGTYFTPIPELDENGCLILKRKNIKNK